MSMRNIRKLFGGNTLPPPDSTSDEEYEPLYAKSKFDYHGLILSSHSESDQDSTDAVGMESAEPEPMTKTKKKKKKKKQKMKHMARSSSKDNLEELDEIDKSVREVNAILGTPSPVPEPDPSAQGPPVDRRVEIMTVQVKHLNANNELRKLFGPEEPGVRRPRTRLPNLVRLRKAVIAPVTDALNFQKSGLSMSIHRRENDCTFFAFDHTREYQRVHRQYLQLENFRGGNLASSVEEAQRNMHVEAMLECADSMFRVEAYSAANTLIEQAIAYMQNVAHPTFNLTDLKVRLEYRILENRPFHVAVLKYLYLLTNRACHRTALELAKMLLNLDPTDPLAILLIIDTLALRAREHQWLIEAVDYWNIERDASFLFNMQYSYSMAHFHVALKTKSDQSKADELLRTTMLRFPAVVLKLMQNASVTPSARVQACPLFKNADDTTGKSQRELMALYAKFTWSKWREPEVLEWFTKNVNRLAEDYESDPAVRERATELANERLSLFSGWPEEVTRHLSVIKPMSDFLVDGAVPRVNRTQSADPVPPAGGLSRYGYDRVQNAISAAINNTPLYDLFLSSALPHYALPMPPEFHRRVVEAVGAEEAEALAAVPEPGPVAGEVLDALTDDENGENSLGLFLTVSALTNAIRRFMDAYEHTSDTSDSADNLDDPDDPNNPYDPADPDNPADPNNPVSLDSPAIQDNSDNTVDADTPDAGTDADADTPAPADEDEENRRRSAD